MQPMRSSCHGVKKGQGLLFFFLFFSCGNNIVHFAVGQQNGDGSWVADYSGTKVKNISPLHYNTASINDDKKSFQLVETKLLAFFFFACLLISSTSVLACDLGPSVKGFADFSFQAQFFCNSFEFPSTKSTQKSISSTP